MMSGHDAVGTRAEIAAECHLSHGTVWRLTEGSSREPLCSTGHKIGQPYQKAVGKRPPLIGNAWSTRKPRLPWGSFEIEYSTLGTEKVRLT